MNPHPRINKSGKPVKQAPKKKEEIEVKKIIK